MKRLLVLAAVAAVAFGLIPAGSAAAGCGGIVTDLSVMYIDDRRAGDPASDQIWIYMESNDTAGLQTGGLAIHGLYGDYCVESSVPDQLVS